MNYGEYTHCLHAFVEAFGGIEMAWPWKDMTNSDGTVTMGVKNLDAAVVLAAIASVKANPLSKFNRDKAGMVLSKATAPKKGGNRRRGKRQQPFLKRRTA